MLAAATEGGNSLSALYEASGVVIVGILGLVGVFVQQRRRGGSDGDDDSVTILKLARTVAQEQERADREHSRAERYRRRAEACEAREADRETP